MLLLLSCLLHIFRRGCACSIIIIIVEKQETQLVLDFYYPRNVCDQKDSSSDYAIDVIFWERKKKFCCELVSNMQEKKLCKSDWVTVIYTIFMQKKENSVEIFFCGTAFAKAVILSSSVAQWPSFSPAYLDISRFVWMKINGAYSDDEYMEENKFPTVEIKLPCFIFYFCFMHFKLVT